MPNKLPIANTGAIFEIAKPSAQPTNPQTESINPFATKTSASAQRVGVLGASSLLVEARDKNSTLKSNRIKTSEKATLAAKSDGNQ
jgi:hypothetical protein